MRATAAALSRLALWRARAPWWFGFGSGVLLVIGAVLARLAMLGVSDQKLAYVTFWPATIAAALVGGLSAGLTAVLLSALVVHVVFIPLRDFADGIGLAVFLTGSGFTVGITELFLQSRARELAANETETIKSRPSES